jgi:hypothetical protein
MKINPKIKIMIIIKKIIINKQNKMIIKNRNKKIIIKIKKFL